MAGRTPNISNTWPPSRRSRDSNSALSRPRPTVNRAKTITMSPPVRPSIALDRAEQARSAQIANTCSNSSSKIRRLPNSNQPNAVAKHRGTRTERRANANNNSNRMPGRSNNPLDSRLQVVTMAPSKKRCKLSSNRSEVMSNDLYERSNLARKNSFVLVSSSLIDRLDCSFNSHFYRGCLGTTFCVDEKFEYIK